MEVTDMTDSNSHKLLKSEVDADNEKKNTVADCDNSVTEFDMMLTAEENCQGTDNDLRCSEIAEANHNTLVDTKSTCCTSGTFQSLPGLEKTINNPENCVNVTKSSNNHCLADKLWFPSDRTEHDAFTKEIEQKTDFVCNSGIDQVLSASDKVGLKSESGMFHDNNMDMIYDNVDSKSELLADMNETGVQDLNGFTSEYLNHPEDSKNVVGESNTNLDAGDFDHLKSDSEALILQYENHSEDNKSECGFEMDAHTAICSQYKLTDRGAAINESASDRVVDESLNPLSSVFYGKEKSNILASCNANQHESNGQESYAKLVATTVLPVISSVINTHHKTEEASIQTHCDSLHPVILPVIASDSRISQSEEEICEKTFEEIKVNEGCLEKVLNCEAVDNVQTSEEVENVPDPPSEYLHEKDSCLAIFGTLLVIMCLNLYASSNEHVHARETDLMESSDDLGLDLLFKSETEEKSSRNPRRQVCVRSKAARKRKKQQQKLLPLLAKEKKKNKLKFAENFEDLKSAHSYIYCEDVDQTLTCPICLEMYYLPCLCQPCGHLFCDPCLRRLTGQGSEGILCPLCRTVIGSCVLDKEFNDQLRASHPEIYFTRHSVEKRSKYRHFLLPFTPPVPLSKRLLRQLVTNRPNLPLNQGTVHNCSKVLLGCLVGACLSVLIMLFWKVRGIQSAKDVNIVFLSFFAGALVTVLVNKYLRF